MSHLQKEGGGTKNIKKLDYTSSRKAPLLFVRYLKYPQLQKVSFYNRIPFQPLVDEQWGQTREPSLFSVMFLQIIHAIFIRSLHFLLFECLQPDFYDHSEHDSVMLSEEQ